MRNGDGAAGADGKPAPLPRLTRAGKWWLTYWVRFTKQAGPAWR